MNAILGREAERMFARLIDEHAESGERTFGVHSNMFSVPADRIILGSDESTGSKGLLLSHHAELLYQERPMLGLSHLVQGPVSEGGSFTLTLGGIVEYEIEDPSSIRELVGDLSKAFRDRHTWPIDG